jgi:hypothetical protein
VATHRRAKIGLIASLGVTALLLATATGAGAAASFNPLTRTGFISRGDVTAAAGARALVADPIVAYNFSQAFTETCTFTDGSSVQASGTHFVFLLFQAETRYAPGSRRITGYTISPADVIDGDTNQPDEDRDLCWQARGVPDDGSPITQTYRLGQQVKTLTFSGPGIAFALPFHS